ncbi:hypothetical protein GCK72_011776 [Caenorhabditis remanei]|uniref:Uncharacterized protein n=1 Tax=Caenorhabditis remanei TaxID=31234 RepID=A0A6A5H6Q0_CAERE|nr:hypothetical protein GCK72_011776 [Caenorhabditis remanei]KAF1763510.1 hypothetical protein GCK72_011776 [Caenorhabditis remanei]
MVGGRLLLLLLTISLPSAAVPTLPHVFFDDSQCVNLRCEWRGVGKQCKSATVLETDYGHYFEFLKDDESDNDLLTRIKLRHPLNTFMIVNNAELGEMCKGRRLWCNVVNQYGGPRAYEMFFEFLLSPGVPIELRPKLHC